MIKTVKKYLSLIMAVAVVLSAFACVSVSATEEVEAVSGLVSGPSYYFVDFESGDDKENKNLFSTYYTNYASFAIHTEGAGGSSKSLKWTEETRVNEGVAGTALHVMLKPNGDNANLTVPAGHSVELSFKVKLAQPLTSGHVSVQLTIVTTGAGTQYPNIWYTTIDPNETEKWQNVSFSYTNTYSGDVTFRIQQIMFSNVCDANATELEGNYVLDYTPATEDAPADYGTRTYYIDDFEFGAYAPEALLSTNVSSTANYENYYVNYENLPSNALTGNNAYYVKKAYLDGEGYVSLADIGKNSANSLKVDPTGTTVGKLDLGTLGGNLRPKALAAGDKFKLSFDLKLGSPVTSGRVAGVVFTSGWGAYFDGSNPYVFTELDKTNTTDWQHFELSYVETRSAASDFGDIHIRFYDDNATNTGWTFEENAADPYVYIDNLSVIIDRAAYPKTGVSIWGLSAAGAVGGNLTANYTFNLNPVTEGVTDASVIRLVAKDSDGLYSSLASTTAGNALVIPTTAEGKDLYVEVVATDSTGRRGRTYLAPVTLSTPVITETTIAKDGTNVVVSAATDITDARLIFVQYENEKMVDFDLSATVTVAANNTTTVAIPADFQTGTVKVMLWDGLSTLVPLADVLE